MYRTFTRLGHAAQTGLKPCPCTTSKLLDKTVQHDTSTISLSKGPKAEATCQPGWIRTQTHSTPLASGQQSPPDCSTVNTVNCGLGTTLMLQIKDSSTTFKHASLN
jgi:hypothetical protein